MAEATGTCPQCGAPVKLDIGDPLLKCDFCRTSLYMIPPAGIFNYLLKPAASAAPRNRVFHLPYWRFRGFKFRVHADRQTECSLVDATVQAFGTLPRMPLLGLAPELGSITLNPEPPPGLSLLQKPHKALEIANARIEALLKGRPVMQGIMAENKSIIQAPFELMEETPGRTALRPLWEPDAVSIPLDKKHLKLLDNFLKPDAGNRRIRFLPLICPECGNDLPAFPRATALLCRFCNRIWGLGSSRLFPRRFSIAAESIEPDTTFLPFWHIGIHLKNFPVQDRYSFFKTMFPYKQTPDKWKNQLIPMVIPAFKINPRLFFRLASRMTRSAIELPNGPAETAREIPALHVVNFTLEEATHSVRILLYELFRQRKYLIESLPDISIGLRKSQLVLLPFRKQGREFIELHSGQAVPTAAIELGTRL